MEVTACRCCLSPGIHKDLNTSYMWLNNKEVYSEMLQECFNIVLKMSDGASMAICEECIKLLRSSCNFKRQVLHNEEELLRTLSDVKDEEPKEIKLESPLFDGDDSDDYFMSDEDQKHEIKWESSLDEKDDCFYSDAEFAEEDFKPYNAPNEQLNDATVVFEINSVRKLVSAVIQHSTIMPFRWHSNKYMCFYCSEGFSSSKDLRQHTATEHKKPKLDDKIVKNTSKIKFDVTEITCKKCGQKLDSLNELYDHLIEEHDMKLNKEQSVFTTAFKLADDGMFCLECGQKFLFFGTLSGHVNRFHSKTEMFPCEICGKGFVTKGDVIKHVKAIHTTGTKISCSKCDKIYSSEFSLADHMRRMHREERLKCPKCPEILRSPYMKKRHMVLVHDVKKFQFKCDQCPKTFMFLSKLARHKAMLHLKEKNVTCQICGFKVFNNELLRRHMARHDDARPFQCEYCKVTLRTKKSLDFHIRTHTNDRRYVCDECGKAFIQPTSLKLHRNTHKKLAEKS